MNTIYANIDDAMSSAFKNVMAIGAQSKPRDMLVKELIGQSVSFCMKYPISLRPSRQLGYRFAPAEAAWILSGRNDVEYIKKYSPFINQFSDDGYYYQGAYGIKFVEQACYVCDTLIKDNDSRQAVINIWRENPRTSRDIPCTLSYQFLIRGKMLHCVQSMRSSDVWLGYPYDAFNAAMMTGFLILMLKERAGLDLDMGIHTMNVGSQHVYEKNWKGALKFIEDNGVVGYPKRVHFNPHYFETSSYLVKELYRLADCREDHHFESPFFSTIQEIIMKNVKTKKPESENAK